MKKILVLTDNFGPQTGGAYAAVSSTVYQLAKNGMDIRLVYFKDSISNRSRNLFTLIKNAEIVHFFGAWTWVHIKTMIISILLGKKL